MASGANNAQGADEQLIKFASAMRCKYRKGTPQDMPLQCLGVSPQNRAGIFPQEGRCIELMDKTGFDAVWLAEHHFSTYSVCPSVHIMGAHLAAHTKNLRIGTGISLASFYHPLRLAEEVALLDQLTKGRVNWGAGRGFDAKEHEAFGVPSEDSYPKFRESVEVVVKAWQEGSFSQSCQFYDPRSGCSLAEIVRNHYSFIAQIGVLLRSSAMSRDTSGKT